MIILVLDDAAADVLAARKRVAVEPGENHPVRRDPFA
jgi:hypothetical protein